MGQPSAPPPPIIHPPSTPILAPPPQRSQSTGGNGGGCQVRCAGCKMVLTVRPGLTEFACPSCKLPQMLPPELMQPNQVQVHQLRNVPAYGIDPTKIQLPCAHCKALLNVPHGLSRFSCPQCGIELAVDLSKFQQFSSDLRLPPPPEEVNE
ncbi:strawberry notch, partial [Olea europaea subsp. europaea]